MALMIGSGMSSGSVVTGSRITAVVGVISKVARQQQQLADYHVVAQAAAAVLRRMPATTSNSQRRMASARSSNSSSSKRWSLDDVDRISRGKASKNKTGSRNVPHRLNSEEREAFELARKRGILVVRPRMRRYPVVNTFRNLCDAVGWPNIRIEQGTDSSEDRVVVDLSTLWLEDEAVLQNLKDRVQQVMSRDLLEAEASGAGATAEADSEQNQEQQAGSTEEEATDQGVQDDGSIESSRSITEGTAAGKSRETEGKSREAEGIDVEKGLHVESSVLNPTEGASEGTGEGGEGGEGGGESEAAVASGLLLTMDGMMRQEAKGRAKMVLGICKEQLRLRQLA